MLELNGQRMSKSTGNIVNPEELLSGKNKFFSKAYPPNVIRFFNAQSSYRSVLDLTDAGLSGSEKGFNRLMDAVDALDKLEPGKDSTFNVEAWKENCYKAMNDDFNSPVLIAHLFEGVKWINQMKENEATLTSSDFELFKNILNIFIHDVLGLTKSGQSESHTDKLSAAVEILIDLRQEARANKDFSLSDKIRDQLSEKGIQLNDGKDGTTFSI